MKCDTCQSEATVHIEVINCHLCATCLSKIDFKIYEMNRKTSKIDPQWIAIADELPEHDTACIVGNVNKLDRDGFGESWNVATFMDRQKSIDETHEAMASVNPNFNCIMKAPLIGPRLVFQIGKELKEPTEFTHWWPIPKPFTEHPV